MTTLKRVLRTGVKKCQKYSHTPIPYGELFDLDRDPRQLYNVWNDANYQSVKKDLLIRLLHRLSETDSMLPRRLGYA